jgi:hypothetical protein
MAIQGRDDSDSAKIPFRTCVENVLPCAYPIHDRAHLRHSKSHDALAVPFGRSPGDGASETVAGDSCELRDKCCCKLQRKTSSTDVLRTGQGKGRGESSAAVALFRSSAENQFGTERSVASTRSATASEQVAMRNGAADDAGEVVLDPADLRSA